MFRICRGAESKDGTFETEVIAVAETRDEARDKILQELQQFDKSDRNEEHDYWWGRNEGAQRYRFFIEGAQAK